MARSTTKVIKPKKLASDPALASVILRLMMFINDISIANAALNEWGETDDRRKATRREGGKLYYGRMQMGHIYEAMLVIEEIIRKPTLRACVDMCDQKTIASFAVVEAFINGPDHIMLLRLRNNAAFHYDGKLALKYLDSIVEQFPDYVSMYSLGTETLDWYFEVADLVVDKIVVRDIFKIQGNIDFSARRDEVLGRLDTMAIAFTDFAGHFIRHHI